MSQEPELISRKVLFGNPERTSVRLSHDGAHISYLAPVGRGHECVGGAGQRRRGGASRYGG